MNQWRTNRRTRQKFPAHREIGIHHEMEPLAAEAEKLLGQLGLNDHVTVKEHRLTLHGLAQYRGLTQFRGHGYPIVWIASDLESKMRREFVNIRDYNAVAIDSILHEYGHVIAEFGRVRSPAIQNIVVRDFDDEEDFAERFTSYVRFKTRTQNEQFDYMGVSGAQDRAFAEAIEIYKREAL